MQAGMNSHFPRSKPGIEIRGCKGSPILWDITLQKFPLNVHNPSAKCLPRTGTLDSRHFYRNVPNKLFPTSLCIEQNRSPRIIRFDQLFSSFPFLSKKRSRPLSVKTLIRKFIMERWIFHIDYLFVIYFTE